MQFFTYNLKLHLYLHCLLVAVSSVVYSCEGNHHQPKWRNLVVMK